MLTKKVVVVNSKNIVSNKVLFSPIVVIRDITGKRQNELSIQTFG